MRVHLKCARVSSKMTQLQLAQKLGISTRYYQSIETGKEMGAIKLWDMLEDIFQTPQRQLRENKLAAQDET